MTSLREALATIKMVVDGERNSVVLTKGECHAIWERCEERKDEDRSAQYGNRLRGLRDQVSALERKNTEQAAALAALRIRHARAQRAMSRKEEKRWAKIERSVTEVLEAVREKSKATNDKLEREQQAFPNATEGQAPDDR